MGIGILKPDEAGKRAREKVAQWEAGKRKKGGAEAERAKPAPERIAVVPTQIPKEILEKAERIAARLPKGADPRKCMMGIPLQFKLPDKEELKRTILEAAEFGYYSIIDGLKAQGADLEVRNSDGQTPLMLASLLGHAKVVDALIRNGADFNAVDPEGRGPLFAAASEGHVEVVRVLLRVMAADSRTGDGKTALMRAAWKGHFGVVDALLAAGADINAKDLDGRTALDKARAAWQERMVEYLKQKGAKE